MLLIARESPVNTRTLIGLRVTTDDGRLGVVERCVPAYPDDEPSDLDLFHVRFDGRIETVSRDDITLPTDG